MPQELGKTAQITPDPIKTVLSDVWGSGDISISPNGDFKLNDDSYNCSPPPDYYSPSIGSLTPTQADPHSPHDNQAWSPSTSWIAPAAWNGPSHVLVDDPERFGAEEQDAFNRSYLCNQLQSQDELVQPYSVTTLSRRTTISNDDNETLQVDQVQDSGVSPTQIKQEEEEGGGVEAGRPNTVDPPSISRSSSSSSGTISEFSYHSMSPFPSPRHSLEPTPLEESTHAGGVPSSESMTSSTSSTPGSNSKRARTDSSYQPFEVTVHKRTRKDGAEESQVRIKFNQAVAMNVNPELASSVMRLAAEVSRK